MQRAQIVPVVLLVLGAFLFLFLSVRSSTPADQEEGKLKLLPATQVQSAPDWTLPDVASGQAVRLSEQARKHPVVFSFWATWCGPCREEIPHLERLSRKYQGRVAFYGINSNDPPDHMTAFAHQLGVTYPQLSDARRDAATRYGADSIPMLFVVDTHDKVRAVTVGYDDSEDLEGSLSKILDTLLAQSRTT